MAKKEQVQLHSRPFHDIGEADFNPSDKSMSSAMTQLWVDIGTGKDVNDIYGWEQISNDGTGHYLNLKEAGQFNMELSDDYQRRMEFWEEWYPWVRPTDDQSGGEGLMVVDIMVLIAVLACQLL